jgi:hypothetical protein
MKGVGTYDPGLAPWAWIVPPLGLKAPVLPGSAEVSPSFSPRLISH